VKMEMKLEQKFKIILLILIIILISLMSFGGLFIQKNGRMANLLPEYIKGMDLKGNRYITFEVVDDTEESTEQGKEETTEETEKESVNTKENFIKARKIIEKRLKEMNVAQYTIAQDEETGKIVVNMVEDTATDTVIQYAYAKGNLTIEDPDKNVLLDSSKIKQVKTMYANTDNGTSIYLNIEFNEEGKEILKNISNEYKVPEKVEENNDDNEENTTDEKEENSEENEKESKEVTIKIDGSTVLSTQFEKEITNGSIQLSVGGETKTQAELQSYVKEAGYDSMEAAAEDGTAFVFMGHGTSHTANVTYDQMQTQMDNLGFTNAFIGTVEGEPEDTACDEVINKVKDAGFKKVILRPLMVVAGDHANNDMAGDDDDSWKSMFEASGDFDEIDCQIEGLGRIDAVEQLYVAHTQAAIDSITK